MGTAADEMGGWDRDWLACDADGRVALFTTAGRGYVPDSVARDIDDHDQAIAALLDTPATCVAIPTPAFSPDYQDVWRRAAERGLFVFDSDPNEGPYVLTLTPSIPILVSDLPLRIATVVRDATFAHLRFADLDMIGNDWFTPD